MADIVMPRLSDSMEEGTVLQWLKQVGDEIAVGDELVEIETDKANMAYESDLAGTLSEILVQEGETVAIGTPIARIGGSESGTNGSAAGPVAAGDQAPRPAGPVAGLGSSSSQAAGEEPSPTPPTGGTAPAVELPATEAGDGHRPKASPLARRLAKEKGLDLNQLQGSGPGGRIVKADVESASSAGDAGAGVPRGAEARPAPSTVGDAAAAGSAAETAKGQTTYEDLSKLQATVTRRMAESKATAPHFYLRAEVDMSLAVEGRARLKAAAGEGSVVPSFNDMVVKACALALREHPRANGAYRDGRFELYSRVNVGVAVAARDALVVPTLFDADRKGLRQLATESRALAQRVRDGEITPPELSGATFTVSNLGMYGIDGFSAVINPPQAAILAVGAITERPVVRDGEISTAHLMQVDLACDHRILYGAQGAEFLARIRTLLEEPLSLAL
ncbi:MAG TPA: dihydrolipoamide acetyltransferase family protein [Solirubrobacterales bacterium]|nr:dihydrolipoamide acetyltransferase family protein [Solirubrobacterales bacterium]